MRIPIPLSLLAILRRGLRVELVAVGHTREVVDDTPQWGVWRDNPYQDEGGEEG